MSILDAPKWAEQIHPENHQTEIVHDAHELHQRERTGSNNTTLLLDSN